MPVILLLVLLLKYWKGQIRTIRIFLDGYYLHRLSTKLLAMHKSVEIFRHTLEIQNCQIIIDHKLIIGAFHTVQNTYTTKQIHWLSFVPELITDVKVPIHWAFRNASLVSILCKTQQGISHLHLKIFQFYFFT